MAKRDDSEERALLAELEAVYREVDQRYGGYACPSSSECCHFTITGREPYVTSIELALVERARRARGGPLAAKKRALPMLPGKSSADDRICPLLTREGRCSVYAARPLGCRTFWCHRATKLSAVSHRELQHFVHRIEAIALRHRADGDQGRPLGPILGV